MSTEQPIHQATSVVGNDGKELLKAAIDSSQTITLKALDVIPARSRLTVYVLWTISALAAVTGIVFVFASYPTFGFVIILLAFVTIVVSLFLQNQPVRTSPERLGELAQGQVTAPSWARHVPKIPINPPGKLDELQLSLRQIQTTAVGKLNEFRKIAGRPELEKVHIRANVFLVNTENMALTGAVVLVIPEQLHVNMTGQKDRNMKMLPHEGATGRAFSLGEPSGATAVLDGTRLNWSKVDLFPDRPSRDGWESFTLSEEQNALIGTRLRWIMSFPLRYAGEGRDKTFAVFNIDGIDDALTIDDMRSLAASIEPSIKGFANAMSVLPKVRITIRVEDAPL